MKLADLPKTKMEYYELLIATSASGKFPARENGKCRYRCGDGKVCAAGLLIPDETYDRSLEGCGVHTEAVKFALVVPEGVTVAVIAKVQYAHDVIGSKPWNHENFVRDLDIVFGH